MPRRRRTPFRGIHLQFLDLNPLEFNNSQWFLCETEFFGNDPSAGSPTETLLRLLLPLNDQVRSSSRHDVHNREECEHHQSEDLTKPFNR